MFRTTDKEIAKAEIRNLLYGRKNVYSLQYCRERAKEAEAMIDDAEDGTELGFIVTAFDVAIKPW